MNEPNRPLAIDLGQARQQTLLGIDYGTARIGLAIKPAGQSMVLPRGILNTTDEQDAIGQLRGQIAESGASAVVVGLPVHEDNAQMQTVKRFCRKCRQGMRGVRWFFVDESGTTRSADEKSIDRSTKATDDLAAALILESFLENLQR